MSMTRAAETSMKAVSPELTAAAGVAAASSARTATGAINRAVNVTPVRTEARSLGRIDVLPK